MAGKRFFVRGLTRTMCLDVENVPQDMHPGKVIEVTENEGKIIVGMGKAEWAEEPAREKAPPVEHADPQVETRDPPPKSRARKK